MFRYFNSLAILPFLCILIGNKQKLTDGQHDGRFREDERSHGLRQGKGCCCHMTLRVTRQKNIQSVVASTRGSLTSQWFARIAEKRWLKGPEQRECSMTTVFQEPMLMDDAVPACNESTLLRLLCCVLKGSQNSTVYSGASFRQEVNDVGFALLTLKGSQNSTACNGASSVLKGSRNSTTRCGTNFSGSGSMHETKATITVNSYHDDSSSSGLR